MFRIDASALIAIMVKGEKKQNTENNHLTMVINMTQFTESCTLSSSLYHGSITTIYLQSRTLNVQHNSHSSFLAWTFKTTGLLSPFFLRRSGRTCLSVFSDFFCLPSPFNIVLSTCDWGCLSLHLFVWYATLLVVEHESLRFQH